MDRVFLEARGPAWPRERPLVYGPQARGVQPLDRLLDLLMPVACLACGRRLPPGRHPLLLCVVCRGQMPRPVFDRCRGCLSPRPWPTCCRGQTSPVDAVIAPWPFAPPLDAVLRSLKFHGLDFLGRHLAEALTPLLRREAGSVEVVTAVPLHWWRRLRRGYDQAERIASSLASELGVPYSRLLRRRRWTPPQTGLDRAGRKRNLQGAFAARTRAPRSVWLVDDVVTTGTTTRSAARILKESGATRVTVVAVAVTPPRGGRRA